MLRRIPFPRRQTLDREARRLRRAITNEATEEVPQRRSRRSEAEDCDDQENSVKISNTIPANELRLAQSELKESEEQCASATSDNSGRGSTESLVVGPVELNTATTLYLPGDLLWAKMGKHSFWPCMVTVDVNNEYFRRKAKYTIFHVCFFGAVDSFGWTDGPRRVMKFAGKDNYQETVKAMVGDCSLKARRELEKFYNLDVVRSEFQERNFQAALSKANTALRLTNAQRIEQFDLCLAAVVQNTKNTSIDRTHLEELDIDANGIVADDVSKRQVVKQTKEKRVTKRPHADKRSASPATKIRGINVSKKLEHGTVFKAVCSTCLNQKTSVELRSCKCGNSFHADCVPQQATRDKAQTLCCAQCQSSLCAICELDIDDCVAIPATCCQRRYHMSCIRRMGLRCQFSQDQQRIQECPRHVCLNCQCRGNLIHCVKCPVAYHKEKICVSASSQFLTPNHILCLRHAPPPRNKSNLNHCVVCRKSGSLICCDICPAVVHAECASEDMRSLEQRQWFCTDCVEGRFPVFGQICWGKIGTHPWWPVKVLHPSEMPERCLNVSHAATDLAVFYFGCPDSQSYGWLAPSRVFPYSVEDNGAHAKIKANQKQRYFQKALSEAKSAFEEFTNEQQKVQSKMKPPKFRKISSNKVVSASCRKRRLHDVDPCSCDARSPCVDNTCTNRAVYVECSDDCVERPKCENRRFQEKAYKATKLFRTPNGRGWGLQAAEDVSKDDFVLEYVGEIIDAAECDRRLAWLHAIGDPNVYFLEADANYIIDAGPAGNEARFINHSCEPNLRTEKWTVNGKLCVGLFAERSIKAGEELTFNYNMQCSRNVMESECLCNAPTCLGSLGVSRKQYRSPTP